MDKNHPNYSACIAWANGELVQSRHNGSEWTDWFEGPNTPSFNSDEVEWRPKPLLKPIMFRTYLYQALEGPRAGVTHSHDLEHYDPESSNDFIRWLDPGWRELSY